MSKLRLTLVLILLALSLGLIVNSYAMERKVVSFKCDDTHCIALKSDIADLYAYFKYLESRIGKSCS
jgi:hypothetical protein